MRTFLWLTTVVLVAAGLGVVAVADYADRHPSSALNEGLARMALAWTGTKATKPTTPACEEEQSPGVDTPGSTEQFGIEPEVEVDDTLLRELKIISELGTVPELIPVDPIEVTDEGSVGTKFGTFTPDEFSPTTPADEAEPFKKILVEVLEDRGGLRNREEPKNEAPLTPDEFVENLKKAKAQPPDALDGVRVGSTSDLDIPLSVPDGGTIILGGLKRMPAGRSEFGPRTLTITPDSKCSACGVCAMLCSFCDCMSQFVAGLFGGSVEVEVEVCPDLVPPPPPACFSPPGEPTFWQAAPCCPPTPADVFMMLTCPRGLPADCCVPVPPMPPVAAGQVMVPVHRRMPDGQLYVTYIACPQPAMAAYGIQAPPAPMPCPALPQAYPHPVPMQPTLAPGQFIQLPCPPPYPGAPQGFAYPAPWPAQPGVMQAQFAVPQPPCQPCQPPVFAQWRPGQPVPTPTAPMFNVQFPYAPPMPAPMAATRATCCASPRTDKGFAKEVSVEFKDQPLCEVLEQFREMADLNIVCDKPSLDANGNAMDQPVTLKLAQVPCRVALKHALRHCGLVCKVEDDVVVVTTEQVARGQVMKVIHNVADICDVGSARFGCCPGDKLIRLIQCTVEPKTWDIQGGCGHVEFYPAGKGLIVNQTPDVQEQVQQILARLRELRGAGICALECQDPFASEKAAPGPCPIACPVPCPTACPPIAATPCSDVPCIPPCAKGTCPRDCCEKDACAKECEANVICAPRVRLACADGTIVEIEIKLIKSKENSDSGLKQASFDIETLEAVPAVTHPKDLPGAEHPDDLPNGGHIDGFGAREGWDVIRSISVGLDEQLTEPKIPDWVLQAMGSGKVARLQSQLPRVVEPANAEGVVPTYAVFLSCGLYAAYVADLATTLWPF